MNRIIVKISMASKMAAKFNNYIDYSAEEVSICYFDLISCINIVLSYVVIFKLNELNNLILRWSLRWHPL